MIRPTIPHATMLSVFELTSGPSSAVLRALVLLATLAGVTGCSIPSAVRADDSGSKRPQHPIESTVVELEGDVHVVVGGGRVDLPGWIALSEGWLEVAVCRQGTREHESIVATMVRPSVVHSAMLLAGFEPGSPALYRSDAPPVPAHGASVAISLEIDGVEAIPLIEAIEDERGSPSLEWVFAGSGFRPNPESMGPGEFYMADYAGTIVGLTAFGDEVVAAVELRSPEVGIDPAVWRIRSGVLPPEGTPVRIVLEAERAPE